MSLPRLKPVADPRPRAAAAAPRPAQLSDEPTQELSTPGTAVQAPHPLTDEITARRPMPQRPVTRRPSVPAHPRANPVGVMRLRSTPAHHSPTLFHNGFLDLNFNTFLSGGSASQAAIVLGVAHGTRTPDGAYTRAWSGAVGPNGERTIGSLSHKVRPGGPTSPDGADVCWLKKLKDVMPAFESKARQAGLNPNNALLACTFLDLFTQSAPVATGRGGFLDQLQVLAQRGGPTVDNLVHARVDAHRDPLTGALALAGVAQAELVLTQEQDRRTQALARALEAQGLAVRTVAVPR